MGKLMTGAKLRIIEERPRPTPLLTYISASFADDIAAIWPAPHAGFLTLPTARRHLVAILIDATRPKTEVERNELADLVTFAKDREVARWITKTGNVSMMRMLSRFGETLWDVEYYRLFVDLCVRYGASKTMAHMKAFDSGCLAVLQHLPEPFVHPRILSNAPTALCAEDLREAISIIAQYDGDAAIECLAKAMVHARSPVTMMRKVEAALLPNIFSGSTPEPKLPVRFQPIVDRKQLRAVALRFKNCLRDYDDDLACGQNMVFLIEGDPAVVLAIERDARGWMLNEAKIKGNEEVPKSMLADLISDLRKENIRVGSELTELVERLHRHVCPSCRSPRHAPWPQWRKLLAEDFYKLTEKGDPI